MSKGLTMKGQRCAGCAGQRAHHADLEDGCWCPACLRKPVEDRCRDWQPEDYDLRKVDRNVVRVGKRHPETAKQAADLALPRSGSLRRELYDLLARRPMTDDELEQTTCRSHQTVSGCRNTLMNDGLIADSGLRRQTRYGNDAIVWQVVPPGVQNS